MLTKNALQETFDKLNVDTQNFKQSVINHCSSIEPEEAFEMLTKFKIFDSYDYNTLAIFNTFQKVSEFKRLNKIDKPLRGIYSESIFNDSYKELDTIDFETYVEIFDREEVWNEETLSYISVKPNEISLIKLIDIDSRKIMYEYKISRREFYKTIVDIMLKHKVCGYTIGFFPC